MTHYAPEGKMSFGQKCFQTIRRALVLTACERKWVRSADKIVCVTDPWAQDLSKRYPEKKRDITVVTNGFDEEEYAGLQPSRIAEDKFTMCYTGRFWAESPNHFLMGMKLALQKDDELGKKMQCICIGGDIPSEYINSFSTGIFKRIVILLGPRSHRETLAFQIGSDVNVIILPKEPHTGGTTKYPVKLFEYIRAKRPVLAVAPEGLSAELVRQLNLGIVVDPEDCDAIASAIITLFNRWKRGLLDMCVIDEQVLHRFSRRSVTGTLASLFDMVVK
jgi:glycosyltransferase involved in cell wall biosynthesis